MESLTKTKRSNAIIKEMVQKFFPSDVMTNIRELTEGYFNVAYEIELNHDKSVILKIAPDRNIRVMEYEENMMQSEVNAMQTISGHAGIKAPKVLGADFSCTVCNAPYFFMEKLNGKSLNSVKDTFTEQQIHQFYKETGEIIRHVNDIVCPCFGYPVLKKFQGTSWFPVFQKMMQSIAADAKRGNVDMKIDIDNLWKHLERDREIFEEVTTPRLVHWDGWDGNIFVDSGHVTGVIDWERNLWGDPLMEDGFRAFHDDNSAFFEGYGIDKLSETEYRRTLWYDIHLLSLGSLECEYRHYDTMDMYNWSTNLLQEQVSKL